MAVYFYIAMEIKDTQGNILFDTPITQSAVLTEELMKQYSITLRWNAVTADVLPVGAYIEHNGVRYSLLEPYSPTHKDEATYEYSPVFQHPVMRWGKALFFFYTYSGGSIVSKELDWSLTDNPANFMSAICDAIENETGEKWSYEVASDLAASASLSFSNTDILSGLNSIAGVFKTEWWFDYANKIVYLSKAGHGSAVTLEVGQNVGVPQVTQNKEGYYTRFYGFGSTRNIDQSYAGANVNSIVNRRLTLDPAKYPNGYIDIREGLTQEEVLPVPLVFDDIYPRSSLTISDVKVRMMWRLDDNSQKVQIGTDSEGNPVYDQYAIWYFKIPGFTFSKDLLISGKALSVHFNSGSLNGREFELTYHDKSETLSNSDGTDFVVEAGDYEINFVEEGSYIIPAVTGLIPADGDAVTLFNIIIPEEYKASAYAELEEAVRKRMAQQEEDRNNYTFESNKVAFYESNPNLSIGRLVTFVNGSKSISTRVIKLETQLDYPFEQRITVGNAIIKGSQQTLKEEVVNANQNIDLLAAINESSEAFQQSLQRTQKAVLESIAKMPDLGLSLVEQDGKTWLRSKYDFFSEGEVSSGGASDTEGGSGGSVVTVEQIVTDANGVPIAKINVDGVPNVIYAPRTEEVDLTGYATTDYVNTAIQNAKDARVDTLINTTIPALESDLTALRNDFDALNTLLNDDVSEKIDTWNEVVDFLDEYSGSQDLATILSVMNADIAKRALQTSLDTTNANLNNHIDTFNTFVDATNNTLSSHNNRIKTFEDIIGIDANGDVYIKKKADDTARNFYSYGEVSSGGLSDTGGSTGGASALAGLNDVLLTNPTDGQSLVYDGTLNRWVNKVGTGFSESAMWTALGGSAENKMIAATHIPDLSGKYLPLSGGTIRGTLNIHNTVNRSTIKIVSQTNQPNDLWFGANGNEHWSLTSRDSAENYLFALYANIKDGGVGTYVYTANLQTGVVDFKYQPTVNGNAVIHSGNIGSYKVGDSDKLGGIASGGFVQFKNDSTSIFGAFTNIPIIKTSYITAQGGDNCLIQLPLWSNNVSSEYYTAEIRIILNGTPSFRTVQNGTATDWRNFAFTDSNVASATKLQDNTAYTAWGQTFFENGKPKNVSGRLYDVTRVDLKEWLEIYSSDKTTIIGELGHLNYANVYLRLYNGADLYLGPQYDETIIKNNGNVLIGPTSDNGYKLQVAGSTYISGKHLNIGKSITAYDSLRTEISLINDNTEPSMMILGSDGVRTWGVESRGSSNNYRFGIYSWLNQVHVLGIATNGNVTISSNSVVDQGYKLYVDGNTYVNGIIHTSAWLYTYNGGGWYNATYGTGMYANDYTYVKSYGGKPFFTKGFKAGYNYDNDNRAKIDLISQSDNACDVWLGTNSVRQWSINVRTSTEGYWLGFYNPMYSQQVLKLYQAGGADLIGNFVATGEVTSGSDARYKRIESYAEIDINTIANAPIINFRWTDREDNKLHLGSTAQYWYNTSLLNGVSPTDDEKLWTMGYGQIALASAVSIAKKVVNHEDRLQIVEKELADYKAENQILKQLLNQYRYGIQ